MTRHACGLDGIRMITACFARMHQRCTDRVEISFLFMLQEVRPIGKTRNQLRLRPLPVLSASWRATSSRAITSSLDRLQFVIDHTVTWMPHFPEHHLPATPRTTERITTRT